MTSTPKKTFSLTKLLRLACAGLEILIVIGLLVTAILVPLAESHVATGSRVTIAKSPTTGSFTYDFRLSRKHDVSVTNESSPESAAPEGSVGIVSVGPFDLKAGKEGQFFKGANSDKDVDVQKVQAMVTFKGPERALQALRAFKWPAVISELCSILIGLAFFDMLRRLLSSAEGGDLFTEANVRTLRLMGFLIIVLDLAKFAVGAILINRMNSLVSPFFSDGTWMLVNTGSGKLTGVFSGLTFLLLAEVFREGLKFRKDSDLTI
jgi:Protein of unknown function (DUF2975)